MSVIRSLTVTIIENQEGFFFAFLGKDHPFEEVHQSPSEFPFKTANEVREYVTNPDSSWGLDTGIGSIAAFGEYNIVGTVELKNVYVADGGGQEEEWKPRG